jgi:hypothetical protein
MKCKGNIAEFCGGPNAISLYKKCSGSGCQNVPFSGSSDVTSGASPPANSASSFAIAVSAPSKVVSVVGSGFMTTSTRPASTKKAAPIVSTHTSQVVTPSVVTVTVTKLVSTCPGLKPSSSPLLNRGRVDTH